VAPPLAVLTRPFRGDALPLFAALRQGQPRSIFLDSAARGGGDARYSYLAAGPMREVEEHDPARASALLRGIVEARRRPAQPGLPPFQGGFVGLLGYAMAQAFEAVPPGGEDPLRWPALWGVVVDEFLAVDHALGQLHAVAVPREGEAPKDAEARAHAVLQRALAPPPALGPAQAPPGTRARSSAGEEGYGAMVHAALRHIAEGDVYQVNLAHRLTWPQGGDALALHAALRAVNPSPFGFFLDSGRWQLVSCSPERLLAVRGRSVATRPIAGTHPRGPSPAEDEALAARLRADPKERAEHTMLVDLARNDLGRVCTYGSVRWDEFMTLERYSHVTHLVSNVEGELQPGRGALDAVRALFPGGTITGVPKVRAMEVIAALEPHPRAFYTGSAGWLSWTGDADLNIAIRTLLVKDGQAHAPVGAGIVADSQPAREWRETLHKAAAMLHAAGVEAP
jgi:anthranilate/para-aminobenzoate synthase component I